jgi:DNA mismatch repair ATPase MutS
MACFYDANSDYIFPEISEKNVFGSINLGHPLINKEYRVYNDFQIEHSEQFFIVTGANMAGKSTFLRTLGTNLVLAMIGCPVCAEKFIFKPTPIFTCMRIDDSINEGKSYFHAELTRLKEIVELLERDEYVFIILDELLKGTNSTDKLKGSELFLEKLMNFDKCHGLIATHDLALTNMAGKFPDKIKNICFEVNIENDVMSFDYKLRAGVTKNMNALFLMKQMQII